MRSMTVSVSLLAIVIICSACRSKEPAPPAPVTQPFIEVPLTKETRIVRKAEEAGLTFEAPRQTKVAPQEGVVQPPAEEPVHAQPTAESVTKDMARIEAGKFTIGHIDPSCTDAGPIEASVETFWIDMYEVTNAQWKKFIEATGYEWKAKLSAWPLGSMPEEIASHPVGYISWNDANAYANWIGKRLPAEFEWEIAARGVDKRYYPWGNKFDEKRCNVKQSGIRRTTPVGTYKDSVSPYGCYDMCGNVTEWVQDWYKAYPGTDQINPDFGEKYKVLRGGSFFSESGFRTYERSKDEPSAWTNAHYGFRCAISDSEVQKLPVSEEKK